MTNLESPKDNRLLAALGHADWQRWEPQLERVDLKLGQVLYEPGRAQRYAYFPTSAIISLVYVLSDGAWTETAVVGNEGIVGTSLFLGSSLPGHGSVLVAGQAFRIGAQMIKDEFERSDSVRLLFLRYTQALATQIAQTAVCNRHHTIDQQVCGWLLHNLDRLRGSEVVVTQEVLATMLGVRRESVTHVAGQLQAAGLICYTRGHITVLDRAGLERRACECRAVVKREYDRLSPPDRAAPPVAPRRWASSGPQWGLGRPPAPSVNPAGSALPGEWPEQDRLQRIERPLHLA
jgi:CRP-like cAMP-binding protein